MAELPMRRITVRGIIIDEQGRIFAQRLKAKDGARDYYCTPGGGLDAGETLLEGLRREMIEETGVEPEIGQLLFMQQYFEDVKYNVEFVEFFYHITNAADYKQINLASTTHGEIEVHECGFIDPRANVVLPHQLQGIDIPAAIANNAPVELFDNLPR